MQKGLSPEMAKTILYEERECKIAIKLITERTVTIITFHFQIVVKSSNHMPLDTCRDHERLSG